MKTLIITNSKTIANIISIGLKAYGYTVETLISPTIQYLLLNYKHKNQILNDFIIVDPYSILEEKNNPNKIKILNISPNEKEILFQEKLIKIKKVFTGGKIIGLLTNNDWRDRVNFLNHCGDDVINYPFAFQELLSRMQRLMISKNESVNLSPKANAQITLNINRRSLINNSQEILLKTKEYALLEYLTKNRNRPISNSEIIDHVWEYNKITSNNTVAVHINKLRKKIKPYDLIKTVHGFGYQLEDKGDNVYISTSYDNNIDKN